MRRSRVARIATFAALLAVVGAVRADLPRNTLTVGPPESGGTEKCVRATAPSALCIAVCEVSTPPLMIVGVAPPKEDGALLVFSLDAAGASLAKPEPVRLPLAKPPSLAAFKLIPTAVYAHLRVPIIYVWQDIMPADGTTTAPPIEVVQRDLDHLLIYKVAAAGNTLELVKATARGPWFSAGVGAAAFASDASAAAATPDDRLYVPNLQRANPTDKATPYTPMFGYVVLDPNGMPAETNGALALKTWVDPANFTHIDHPMGVFPFSKNVVFYGGYIQMACLELRGAGQTVALYTEGSHLQRATGHPKFPRVYSVGLNTSYVYNVEHVDGAFTMLPQRASVTWLAALSYPLIDPKANQLVVGGSNGVFLIALDEQGLFTGKQYLLNVGHAVRAVTYSSKFDRIYVPVEKLP